MHKNVTKPLTREEKLHQRRIEYYEELKRDSIEELLRYRLWKEKRKHEFEIHSDILLKSKNLLIHHKSKNLLKPKDDADYDDDYDYEVRYRLWKEKRKHEFEIHSDIHEFEIYSNILLKSKNLLIYLKSKNLLKPESMIACLVIGCGKRKENIRLKYTALKYTAIW